MGETLDGKPNISGEEDPELTNVEGKKKGTLSEHSVLSILRSYERTLRTIIKEKGKGVKQGKKLGNHTMQMMFGNS